MDWSSSLGLSSLETIEMARQYLQEAMKEPTPLAHLVTSSIRSSEGRYQESIIEATRAIVMDANDPVGYIAMGKALVYAGRPNEGADAIKKAMRLNPNYPDWYPWSLALAFFTARQYDEALKVLEETHSPLARRLLAATYAQAGRLEEARTAAKEYLEVNPNFSIKRYMELEPYEDPADLEDYLQGLRKAGLPE